MITRVHLIAASACVLLAGCSAQDAGDKPVALTSDAAIGTVAAAIAGSGDHRKLAMALSDTQLSPVLDGKSAYTLLAPNDDAFAALRSKGTALAGPDQRPLMIAVLRGHILPGQITPKAIEAALARKQGPVAMRTMAGGTVRFSKTAKGIIVTSGTQTATLSNESTTASNGAILPIDKVLLPAR